MRPTAEDQKQNVTLKEQLHSRDLKRPQCKGCFHISASWSPFANCLYPNWCWHWRAHLRYSTHQFTYGCVERDMREVVPDEIQYYYKMRFESSIKPTKNWRRISPSKIFAASPRNRLCARRLHCCNVFARGSARNVLCLVSVVSEDAAAYITKLMLLANPQCR
jgi:hypothetical protein